MTEKKVVLIVVSDLGFMCWLGLTLGAVGLEALPAKNVSNGRQLIQDFDLHVDVLVIDPLLDGAGNFAESLRCSPHHARTIAVGAGNAPPSVPASSPFDLWKALPGKSDAQTATAWVQTVESQLVATFKAVLTF